MKARKIRFDAPKYTRKYVIGDRYECVYCGEMADTLEHCPPLILVSNEISEEDRENLLLVPACRECNTSLGDRYLLTLQDRAEWLVSFYKRKYKKFNRTVAWEEDEIDELDGGLKKFVAGCQTEYDRIRSRLNALRHRMAVGASDLEE
jgi:hypothetical protein